ncbi:Histidine phosphatase superfamily (branch 1) [Nocardioides dokdonensis FR1436]|uniref:Histidine phosphatase superfamily (Branch 1) n=1 Tax=Nocardioides dokdonensis FR1436 TaxID=1300347 RepID=A0A1A9GIQ8_9ACTN|nr:histidine phosphatase family protein [Nocardioides dokdonensis]ANH37552.1 Histidine phosphatase superfamily (branch 1) [Nocardioides dokdonensis FR1436]
MGLVLLVRHGQASFGADDYDVLSPTGWDQARTLGAWLAARGVTPTAVVRGSMRRHRESAEALVEGAGWAGDGASVDEGWDEFDHLGVIGALPDPPAAEAHRGELDRRAFQRVFEQATARWTTGDHDADYPETYAAFRARARGALQAATARAGRGESVVAVTSGGVVAALCAALVLGEDADPASYAATWQRFNTVCVNSSVTRVVVGSTGARLLTFNEHEHLAPDQLTYR